MTYNSGVRRALGVLVAVLVVAGCGSARTHPGTSKAAEPKFTVRRIKRVFATQGFKLVSSPGNHGNFVVLFDPAKTGAFGYQRTGGDQARGTQLLVFVRSGPHFVRRGNLTVFYGDGQKSIVKAALHALAH